MLPWEIKIAISSAGELYNIKSYVGNWQQSGSCKVRHRVVLKEEVIHNTHHKYGINPPLRGHESKI